jgi:hypothetical protein
MAVFSEFPYFELVMSAGTRPLKVLGLKSEII